MTTASQMAMVTFQEFLQIKFTRSMVSVTVQLFKSELVGLKE